MSAGKRNGRRQVRRILPWAVSGGILAWLVLRFDLGAVARSVSPRSALLLGSALAVYGGVSLLLEAVSLSRVLADRRLGPGVAARIKAASYLLSAVHFTVGLGALAVLLARRTGLDLARAAGAVMLLSAVDLGLLIVLSALGTTFLETSVPALSPAFTLGASALGLLGFAAIRARLDWPLLRDVRQWAVFEALAGTPWRRLAEICAWRIAFVSSFVVLIGVALALFGVRVPPGDLVVGVMVASLVSSIPIAVAGLGTGQAIFLYVFRGHGSPEALLACSLVLSIGLIATRALMGAVFAREYAREAARAVDSAGSPVAAPGTTSAR